MILITSHSSLLVRPIITIRHALATMRIVFVSPRFKAKSCRAVLLLETMASDTCWKICASADELEHGKQHASNSKFNAAVLGLSTDVETAA